MLSFLVSHIFTHVFASVIKVPMFLHAGNQKRVRKTERRPETNGYITSIDRQISELNNLSATFQNISASIVRQKLEDIESQIKTLSMYLPGNTKKSLPCANIKLLRYKRVSDGNVPMKKTTILRINPFNPNENLTRHFLLYTFAELSLTKTVLSALLPQKVNQGNSNAVETNQYFFVRNTPILSISAYNKLKHKSLSSEVAFSTPLLPTKNSLHGRSEVKYEQLIYLQYHCVFLDFEKQEWSTVGCQTVESRSEIRCNCNHTTMFAVMLSMRRYSIPPGIKVSKETSTKWCRSRASFLKKYVK